MEKAAIAELFTVLRGGIIQELSLEEETLRFKIYHPQLVTVEEGQEAFFYATLQQCTVFSLQPFRNESTVINQLGQIERLRPEIHEAKVEGVAIKVFCAHQGVSNGARLTLKCERFEVYDQNFDAMSVEELVDRRLKSGESEK